MSWQPEVDEIQRRRALAAQMGGPRGIERQRRRGKLTVRERVDRFGDPGSFQEIRGLSGWGTYDDEGNLTDFVPSTSVEGICRVDGRKVALVANDFTIGGGSGGRHLGGDGQEPHAVERAREWRIPYVRLLDAAGGSVRTFEEMGRTYVPDGGPTIADETLALNEVPVVSAALGSVAGIPAVWACCSHFNLMVEGISQLFPGGPPVVKAALGYDITKEDLGDQRIHVYQSGSINNLAETEDEAFEMIRQFLSYLPSNVWEMAPRGEPTDDPQRRDEWLLEAVPRNRRRPYNVRKIINAVVDEGSFFEISPTYGTARVTGLARVDGYPVAVMGNNPHQQGGATGVAEGEKVIRLLSLCDTFHLPIISFADEPGFLVGLESEKQGIERAGARLMISVFASRMPWLSIVVGQLYGVAGTCQHRPSGMFERYIWPSAGWGSMHIEGGTHAAYRRQIEEAPDPAEEERKIEARLKTIASPFRTAEATGQEIIDPRNTRPLAVEFVHDAQRILAAQVGPPVAPYLP